MGQPPRLADPRTCAPRLAGGPIDTHLFHTFTLKEAIPDLQDRKILIADDFSIDVLQHVAEPTSVFMFTYGLPIFVIFAPQQT